MPFRTNRSHASPHMRPGGGRGPSAAARRTARDPGAALLSLQRAAGNRAAGTLISTLQRAPEPTNQATTDEVDSPEAAREYDLPGHITDAIVLWDWRSITLDDIASLNDDQLLELERQMSLWKELYESTPQLLHEQYKAARGKKARKEAYDLFLNTAKMVRAFKVRFGPVLRRAKAIGLRRGFSIPGAVLGPKVIGPTLWEQWTSKIEAALGVRALAVYLGVKPEVKRRLEFLLWELDYPTPAKTSQHYWMKYGYWTASVIDNVLTVTADKRRTKWSDFAPYLGDAAASIAAAFDAAIGTDSGPAAAASSIDNTVREVTSGFNELERHADGVLNHGTRGVNICELYALAVQMRDVPGSVMSAYSDGFEFD